MSNNRIKWIKCNKESRFVMTAHNRSRLLFGLERTANGFALYRMMGQSIDSKSLIGEFKTIEKAKDKVNELRRPNLAIDLHRKERAKEITRQILSKRRMDEHLRMRELEALEGEDYYV